MASSTSPPPAPTVTTTGPGVMSRNSRLLLIASLYSTQNLSLAAFNYTFLITAQKAGVGLELIGAATGMALILVLKFLWAPLVDRYGIRKLGHYRGWLIVCQLALTVGALALATLDPGRHFPVILAIFAAIFVFAGTQDVAADATATRLLAAGERGLGNGIQSAGSSVAQIVGGGLLLAISGSLGWSVSMLVLAVFSALPLPLVLRWNEEGTTGHLPRPHVTPAQIRGFFTQPGVLRWAFAVIPAYIIGGTVSYNLVRPALVEAGWSQTRLGTIVVIGGGAAGILAGLGAGWLISRTARRRALILLGVVQVIACAATIVLCLQPRSVPIAVVVTLLSSGGFAATTAVLYTIAMDLTRQESSGTDFTLFSALAQIVMVVGSGIGIALSGTLGFTTVAVAATILAIIGLSLAAWLVGPVIERADELNRIRAAAEQAPAAPHGSTPPLGTAKTDPLGGER
ncbi:MFS transporter [Gephyromycinifex aptenodytis]|uniref:MFS transporter n=1 Tax=Gephyromycinifex aptenodytis TaxID=2716227 RepID=UPI001444B20D|nr:MFS transporter [Gephyromycinifex aptenodytis]